MIIFWFFFSFCRNNTVNLLLCWFLVAGSFTCLCCMLIEAIYWMDFSIRPWRWECISSMDFLKPVLLLLLFKWVSYMKNFLLFQTPEAHELAWQKLKVMAQFSISAFLLKQFWSILIYVIFLLTWNYWILKWWCWYETIGFFMHSCSRWFWWSWSARNGISSKICQGTQNSIPWHLLGNADFCDWDL